jgi:CRISPR/Cas system-associated exonuclease Cas4 (RecB family)
MQEIFSPNMLKTYEKCPKKYFFKYIKGLQMPVDDDIFTLGKNIHALASYYLKGENIDKMEKSLEHKEAELWKYLKGVNYFKFNTVNTEYNLSVKIGNNFFGGRLDALVENNGHYYILDYKTGSAPKNAQYDYQTMIYMLCVNKFFKTENVTFVYIDLKNKCEVSTILTKELIEEYENALVKISDKIIRGDFLPSKKDCKHCEYGKICYEKLLD